MSNIDPIKICKRLHIKIPAGQDIIAIVPVGYPEKEPLSPVKTAAMDKTRWGLGR
ncbi:MAG: hypothetical protein K0B84_04330 [Firmicutes bacterium]|nr:hypothetical protein [Bacillota bacterium]